MVLHSITPYFLIPHWVIMKNHDIFVFPVRLVGYKFKTVPTSGCCAFPMLWGDVSGTLHAEKIPGIQTAPKTYFKPSTLKIHTFFDLWCSMQALLHHLDPQGRYTCDLAARLCCERQGSKLLSRQSQEGSFQEGSSHLGFRVKGYSPPQVDRIWLWVYYI